MQNNPSSWLGYNSEVRFYKYMSAATAGMADHGVAIY